jgi:hypothetical protein
VVVLLTILACTVGAIAVGAWLTAMVSQVRAWRLGHGFPWPIWNGMRFLTEAPPAARPHLNRVLLALGVFLACIPIMAILGAIIRAISRAD